MNLLYAQPVSINSLNLHINVTFPGNIHFYLTLSQFQSFLNSVLEEKIDHIQFNILLNPVQLSLFIMFHFPVQIYIVENANLCLVFLLAPKLEPNVQLTPPDVQMPSGLVGKLGKVQQSPKKRWRGGFFHYSSLSLCGEGSL